MRKLAYTHAILENEMIPVTVPSRVNPFGSEVEMVGFYLGSVAGLTKWIDYIPVRTVQTTPGVEGSEDLNGYRSVGVLSSVSGLMAWRDYVPMWLDNSLTVPWSTDANGYIPVGMSGGGASALSLSFVGATALDSRITFTRADATTCATYFDKFGEIKLAAANVPRFDYDPNSLIPRGLMVEEASTNLFLNSLLNGTSLTTQGVTTSAIPYTISFYGTGSITLTGTSTGVISGTGANIRTTSTFTPSAGTLTCTVAGQVRWANIEAKSFATSFIPTAGASVTRAVDVAVMTGANFSSWYNQAEGTFLVELTMANTVDDAIARVFVGSSSAIFNDSIYLGRTASSATVSANILVGGVAQWGSNSLGSIQNNITSRAVLAYKVNDLAGCLNGGSVNIDTVSSIPTVDRAALGSAPWSSNSNTINGWLRKITYYNTRLTNAQLQSLSR